MWVKQKAFGTNSFLPGLFIFLFLCVPPLLAFSEKPGEAKYLHQIWRTEDGLPNPSVRALLQSREGYLWMATDESLVRFDGARFVELDRRRSHRTQRKSDRWKVGLAESKDGSVWVASVEGGVSRVKKGKTTRYTSEQGLLNDYVLVIREDSHGKLWFGTAGGLCSFAGGKFSSYTNEPGLIVEAVRDILEDTEGNLWIGTAKGLSLLKNEKFTSYTTNDLLVNNAVMCLYQDRRDALWIGTSGGLTRVLNGKPTHYTVADGLAHGTVRAMHEDAAGNLWVGTQGGLQQFVNGRFYPVNVRSLSDLDFEGILFVYALAEDREGNLWVGSNLGLNRLQKQKFKVFGKEEGLSHNLADSVFEDSLGRMWIGTYGGGLCRIQDNQIKCWTTDNGLSSNLILGLAEDREGALWIGTEAGGLNRFYKDSFSFFQIEGDARANTIRAICEDVDGSLWIGSNTGLYRFKNGNFARDERIEATEVKVIMRGRGNVVWVGAKPGLTKVSANTVQTFRIEEGLSSDAVNAIYEDNEGVVWIGTSGGGLNRLGKDGKVTIYSRIEGPFNENIVQILEDERANFWLGTRNGIFRTSRKELNDFARGTVPSVSFIAYGKKDGMRRAQCNGIAQPSGYTTRDGEIWFPTMQGVVAFDPKEFEKNAFPPPVLVEEVMVDDQRLESESGARLRPRHGEIEFRYTALSFRAPEKVRFRYRLEGFDSDWRDAGTRRMARYTNLRPGSYRFQVKACNDEGLWNTAGASFAFFIEPHFYQRTWFYLLSAGVMILVGAGLNSLRVRQAQQRERELMRLVEDRTAKLQQAVKSMESFNYSIAHDLRAPLRTIKGFTEALVQDYSAAFDETGHDYSKRIETAVDRMDKLIADLLTFGKLTHKEITCDWVLLEALLGKILRQLDAEINARKARVEICQPMPRVWANETLLEQVLTNLINNGLKFVPKGAAPTVKISAEETARSTKIYVRDNGIGIAPSHHHKIFGVFERLHSHETYPGTGIGLAIVQKAVERMDGQVGVESQLGQGSCFWIELPKPVQGDHGKLPKD